MIAVGACLRAISDTVMAERAMPKERSRKERFSLHDREQPRSYSGGFIVPAQIAANRPPST